MTFNTLKPLKMTEVNNKSASCLRQHATISIRYVSPGVLVWTEIISDYNAYLDGVIQKIQIIFHSCFYLFFSVCSYLIFDAFVACLWHLCCVPLFLLWFVMFVALRVKLIHFHSNLHVGLIILIFFLLLFCCKKSDQSVEANGISNKGAFSSEVNKIRFLNLLI